MICTRITTFRFVLAVLLLLGFGLNDGAAGQEGSSDARIKEIVERIRKTMKEVDEHLFTAGSSRTGRGEEGKDEIKAILDKTREEHRQIIRDIDELIRSIEYEMQSSSSSPDRQMPKPEQKEAEGQKPRQENPGESELKKNPSAKENEKNPEDGNPSKSKPKQEDARNRKQDKDPEQVDHRDTSGRWGLLPPKVQEEILNSNVEDFPQKYRKWLEEYYRTVNKQR